MQPERKKMGHPPTIFSAAIADEICERIAEGEGLRSICRDDHMPGRQTVIDWLADADPGKGPFRTKYARAREAQADWWDEAMHDEAQAATPETVNVARLRVSTMQWRASKLAPKKYGERIDATVGNPDGSPLQVERSPREIAMAVLSVIRAAQGGDEDAR